jgi:hypothetical protein
MTQDKPDSNILFLRALPSAEIEVRPFFPLFENIMIFIFHNPMQMKHRGQHHECFFLASK